MWAGGGVSLTSLDSSASSGMHWWHLLQACTVLLAFTAGMYCIAGIYCRHLLISAYCWHLRPGTSGISCWKHGTLAAPKQSLIMRSALIGVKMGQ